MKPEIITETEDFVVLNKPSGLLSIPDMMQSEISLKDILKEKYGEIFTVHRLDKDTSGVIIFARNESSHKYLSELFSGRSVKKIYYGIVHGSPYDDKGHIDLPIAEHPVKKGKMMVNRKGKPASTEWEKMESFGRFSLIKFRIHTGRTHQIRVHMEHAGYPIICDPIYGDGQPVFLSSFKKKFHLGKFAEEKPLMNRLALHASELGFEYANGEEYTLEAPLPKDFQAFLNQCRKNLK